MNDQQAMVRQFHQAMDIPVAAGPGLLEQDRKNLRYNLIREELEEFWAAMVHDDLIEMIDALCDLHYVVDGAALEMGVDLEPFFIEVHQSNMKKIGGPIREDGKQLKPPGWAPPNLRRVFASLYGNPIPGEVGK